MKYFHKCLASKYCIPDSIHRKSKYEFLIQGKGKCSIQEWSSRLRGQEEAVSLRVRDSEAIGLRLRMLHVEYITLKMYCHGVYVKNLEKTIMDRKQPKPTNFCACLFTSWTFLTITLLNMGLMMAWVDRNYRKTIIYHRVGICQKKSAFPSLWLEFWVKEF